MKFVIWDVFKDILARIIPKKFKKPREISLLKNSIILIDREKEKNEEAIERLDKYKEDYLQVLNSRRTTYSGDFDTARINHKKNLYIEVLLNILDPNKTDLFAKREYRLGEELCSSLCLLARLYAYMTDIKALVQETRERLTALSEIACEKIFLRPSKRRSLNEAINGLESAYLIFEDQLYAINGALMRVSEENKYLMEDEMSKNAQSELIVRMRKELEAMLEEVGSTNLDFFRSIEEHLVAIAKMEQELDEYVYTHKSGIDEVRNQVETLNVEDSAEKIESLSDKIAHFEMLYKVYSTFGRNLVSEDDLIYLYYNKKFSIKIKDIYSQTDGEIVRGASFIEIDSYEKEVISLLDYALKRDTISEYIKGIFGMDQYEEPEERAWRILNDRKLLAFLLAFTQEKGLDKFFNDFLVARNGVQNVDLHRVFFTWQDFIPLESVYTMKYWNEIATGELDKNDALYKFFKYYYKSLMGYSFDFFPEGISHIRLSPSMPGSIAIPEKTIKYYDMLKRLLPQQTIKFPSSLKSVRGDIFSELEDLDIEFNFELEDIWDAFNKSKFVRLILPGNQYVKVYENNNISRLFDRAEIETLCLRDYNSELGLMPEFIQSTFRIEIGEHEFVRYAPSGCVIYSWDIDILPKFEMLEIHYGSTTIRFKAEELKYSVKRERKDMGWHGEFSAEFGEATTIAEDINKRIAESLQDNMNRVEAANRKMYGA